MKEDLDALKKGQAPAGFQLEKQMQKELGAMPVAPSPKMTPAPAKPTEIGLGKFEKAKPLATSPVAPTPLSLKVPSEKAVSLDAIKKAAFPKIRSRVVIAIIILIVASVIVWFFFLRGPSTPPIATSSPTPTPTTTKAPPVISQPLIETILNIHSTNVTVTGSDIFAKLQQSAGQIPAGDPQLYKIFQPLATINRRYVFSDWASKATVPVPQNVLSFVDNDNSYASLFLKTNNPPEYGFVVRLKNTIGINPALKSWETSLSRDLKNIFELDTTKATSAVFLDNTYQGVAIRYMNFPDINKTIDYAILTLSNGENYLVVTNSKDHMYSIINKALLGTLVPTP